MPRGRGRQQNWAVKAAALRRQNDAREPVLGAINVPTGPTKRGRNTPPDVLPGMGAYLLSPTRRKVAAGSLAKAPLPPAAPQPKNHADLLRDSIASFAPTMPAPLAANDVRWVYGVSKYKCAFREALQQHRRSGSGGGAGLAALPLHVRVMAREAVCCSLVAARFQAVHGPESVGLCISKMLGWSVEQVEGGAGRVASSYRMVTYSEWLENGSLRDYLVKLFAPDMVPGDNQAATQQPDSKRYTKTIEALLQVVHLLQLLSRAGVVLGDLKLENLLVDARGRVKLTDLDGASLLPLADVQAAAAQVRAMAQQATVGPAAAGSYCMGQSAVWRALDWQRAPDAPSMMTPGFAPPEMTDAADPHMTALSHVYLVGASLEYVLTQLQDSKLAPGGRVTPGKERDAAFVAELLALAGRMQADAPVRRPTTRTLRQELEGMKARW
eukprot:XP_001692024.1 predicted protein [Chlamydomonas reinhardtii]